MNAYHKRKAVLDRLKRQATYHSQTAKRLRLENRMLRERLAELSRQLSSLAKTIGGFTS